VRSGKWKIENRKAKLEKGIRNWKLMGFAATRGAFARSDEEEEG
jgi:hypothetical protein